jgi:hypothetical protein
VTDRVDRYDPTADDRYINEAVHGCLRLCWFPLSTLNNASSVVDLALWLDELLIYVAAMWIRFKPTAARRSCCSLLRIPLFRVDISPQALVFSPIARNLSRSCL